uniref:Skin calcitonin gene-related peptide n=1 Tax=Anthurium amnicola TaxID=1678845 RepID=A0A1D1XMV5_9ARAE
MPVKKTSSDPVRKRKAKAPLPPRIPPESRLPFPPIREAFLGSHQSQSRGKQRRRRVEEKETAVLRQGGWRRHGSGDPQHPFVPHHLLPLFLRSGHRGERRRVCVHLSLSSPRVFFHRPLFQGLYGNPFPDVHGSHICVRDMRRSTSPKRSKGAIFARSGKRRQVPAFSPPPGPLVGRIFGHPFPEGPKTPSSRMGYEEIHAGKVQRCRLLCDQTREDEGRTSHRLKVPRWTGFVEIHAQKVQRS